MKKVIALVSLLGFGASLVAADSQFIQKIKMVNVVDDSDIPNLQSKEKLRLGKLKVREIIESDTINQFADKIAKAATDALREPFLYRVVQLNTSKGEDILSNFGDVPISDVQIFMDENLSNWIAYLNKSAVVPAPIAVPSFTFNAMAQEKGDFQFLDPGQSIQVSNVKPTDTIGELAERINLAAAGAPVKVVKIGNFPVEGNENKKVLSLPDLVKIGKGKVVLVDFEPAF